MSGPRVLTFTTIFPNASQQFLGLFVKERVRHAAEICNLRVVAPVPWVPPAPGLPERWADYRSVPYRETQSGIEVLHPRFVTIPKVLKRLDPPLLAASAWHCVRTLRREFLFDAIDAHWACPDGVAAVMLGRAFKVPVAITVRGDDLNVFSNDRERRGWLRWALARADHVIALSDELKQRAEALGTPASRVTVIPNGIDTARFRAVPRRDARARLGLADDAQVIISAGRLHASKGFPLVVEALGLMKERFPAAIVVIAGAPDHEADATPAILETARSFGISDRVRLIGPQPADVLVDWYSASDVFCLATEREGSPNVILEALACGLPCVATPTGGIPDIICTPELGILTPPTPRALADALPRALSQGWNRDAIAAWGHRRTWAVVAAECVEVLTHMTARVPANRPSP